MTIVRRRTSPPEPPSRRSVRKKAPLKQRFPVGRRVQVYEDVQDDRYAGRFGTVMRVHDVPEPPVYPHGRVAVLLVIDELYARLYWNRARVPQPVWLKPNDLDRSPDA